MLRLYVDTALAAGEALALPAGAARHVQVRRLQPGEPLVLFDGRGGEWRARVRQIGRQQVVVGVETHHAVDREARPAVTLAVAMPANERMDWLVEKATELGAVAVQPLVAARSVLRLDGERAARKRAHWQAIAVAAAEQCGRTRVPAIHAPAVFDAWLNEAGPVPNGFVLCLAHDEEAPDGAADAIRAPDAAGAPIAAASAVSGASVVTVLSGPEGGLSPQEEQDAVAHGLRRWSLGPRVLRAETAPLAALVLLTQATGPHRRDAARP